MSQYAKHSEYDKAERPNVEKELRKGSIFSLYGKSVNRNQVVMLFYKYQEHQDTVVVSPHTQQRNRSNSNCNFSDLSL